MMYFPLMQEFMKIKEMLSRVVLFTVSKYGQINTLFIWSRNNIWKTKNKGEIKRSIPSIQYSFHFEPVESPSE
jgi:hypothetical protein